MKSQLMSKEDYQTYSKLAESMAHPRAPSLAWDRSHTDAVHLVAEVNSPVRRKRGTILPKIATGRTAQSAKRLWKDYENINIRSSIQQNLESPKEKTVFGRVPKNPKGLYNKPVTDPKPFHILHNRLSFSQPDREMSQLYSQMAFLANAVRNTDGTTSYKNLCLKPEDREGALRRDLNISKAESLRWSSASVRRPIPRLLLPLRPGSSTQWYSWKVDTPRREKKTKIRSSNTDGATSFREKFGDEMVFPSGSNYQEEKVDEEELRETLNVNGNDGTTEQDEKLEVSTQNVDETSKSPNTENTVNLDTNDVNNNLEMVKSDLPSGGAVDNETFITQVVEENDNLTESNKGDASNQQEIVEDNIEPEKTSSLVKNGRNSETAGDGNIAELVNKETHDERMPNFENDSSSNQNEITDQRDKVVETVTECHANENDGDNVTHDVKNEEMNKSEDGEGYIVAMDTNVSDNVDQRESVDSSTKRASSAKETDRNAHISDELPVANEALEVEEEIRPEKESIKDENEMIKDENNVDSVEG